jgi:DNA modification methylase|tara:strand:- start:273 stop:1124 length:852 start_codon:yes stop_codon:yes gene_type:complete
MEVKKENKGKYDKRNKLNDLTGKEWLKLTASFWLSEKCADDKDAYNHPAPFLVKDIQKLISMFTKKEMRVLDPFCGSGTTLLASTLLNRYGIGIDLNTEYRDLAIDRLSKKDINEFRDFDYFLGDSNDILENLNNIDYIVTSPPYHNILKNKGAGIRKENKKGYRNGSRIGVDYYSDLPNDLGNKESYDDFLQSFHSIMSKCFNALNNKKYCSIVISDFTVDKKEVCVQGDIVRLMQEIGFEFVGTIALLQNNKPLYPFGYPYAYKINHHHQNIINFRKVIEE